MFAPATTSNESPAAAAGESPAAAARRIVELFLEALMIPDPVRARTFMVPDAVITFTGGRRFDDPAASAAFNAGRYRSVKKRFECTDVAVGAANGEFIVYNTGTLYGKWPDGEAFSDIRYVDRFVVRDGGITRMDVWNDSAEVLLVRAGLATMQAPALRP